MSFRPLIGHELNRRRLSQAVLKGKLPASLLFQGPVGVGKQRLALWLGQLLLCERAAAEQLDEPCDACIHCRYASRGQHPDLHWFYPRPRLPDADVEDIKTDLAEATAQRMKDEGLWIAPAGNEGIFMSTVKAIVQAASLRPAMARQSVFVIGDAERMVPQASSPDAANAFLKLLEEPPPHATIIITSSEPGVLLPTIKSRVVTLRVLPLRAPDMAQFVEDPVVSAFLDKHAKGTSRAEMMASAAGSPGMLLSRDGTHGAFAMARRVLEAALQPAGPNGAAERIKVSAKQGVSGARGVFADMLDALVVLLHDRARQLTVAGYERHARRTAQGIVTVLAIKEKTETNISPQLLAAYLVNDLHMLLTS